MPFLAFSDVAASTASLHKTQILRGCQMYTHTHAVKTHKGIKLQAIVHTLCQEKTNSEYLS